MTKWELAGELQINLSKDKEPGFFINVSQSILYRYEEIDGMLNVQAVDGCRACRKSEILFVYWLIFYQKFNFHVKSSIFEEIVGFQLFSTTSQNDKCLAFKVETCGHVLTKSIKLYF